MKRKVVDTVFEYLNILLTGYLLGYGASGLIVGKIEPLWCIVCIIVGLLGTIRYILLALKEFKHQLNEVKKDSYE